MSPRWRTVSIASRVVPGNLRDDHPLAADELVEERRLADVRPPEDRDPDRLGADRDLARARQARDDLVEQVAGAVSVQSRERPRLAEPERVEDGRVGVAARIVDLVREHDHRPLGVAEDDGELLVARRDAGAGIDDEQHQVGLVDRGLRLLGDLGAEHAALDLVDTAGVDEAEPGAGPLAEHLLAVARHARGLVDDGGAALREPVDQGRLADVREADDRDGACDLARRLDLFFLDELVLGHRGGVASGRPSACISTRKSKSSLIFACSIADASL